MDRISPVAIARFAYGILVTDFSAVLRSAWLPAAGICLLGLAAIYLRHYAGLWLSLPLMLFSLILMPTVFCVAWHRHAMGAGAAGHGALRFRIGLREAKYVLYLVVFSMLLSLLQSPPVIAQIFVDAGSSADAIVGLLTLAATVVFAGLFARLGLSLPAIAVDRSPAFPGIWRSTRGNGWRLVGLMALVGLPTVILLVVVDTALGGVQKDMEWVALRLIVFYLRALVDLMILVPLLTALSCAYMLLGDSELRPNLPAPPERFLR